MLLLSIQVCRWRAGREAPSLHHKRPHTMACNTSGLLFLSYGDYNERIRQGCGSPSRIFWTWLLCGTHVGAHSQELAGGRVKPDGPGAFLGRHVLYQHIFSVAFANEAHVAFAV